MHELGIYVCFRGFFCPGPEQPHCTKRAVNAFEVMKRLSGSHVSFMLAKSQKRFVEVLVPSLLSQQNQIERGMRDFFKPKKLVETARK